MKVLFVLEFSFKAFLQEIPIPIRPKNRPKKIYLQKVQKHKVVVTRKISSRSTADLATFACFTMENCNETNQDIKTIEWENIQI